MPDIVIKTLPEKLFIPLVYFALLSFLPLRIVNTFRYPKAVIALGPFMLINAKFYRKIGGHENIKDNLVDDLKIAHEVKKNGGKIILMDGKDRVRVRFKINPLLILLHPLSLFLWILIVLNSVRLSLLNKGVVWKERIYSPKKAR